MKARIENVDASIEFAVDNALERILKLEGKDQTALINEYKEWLFSFKADQDILVIKYVEQFK